NCAARPLKAINRLQMATATMLRPCNTQEWVHKSGAKRLTMHSILFSLCSRVAVLWRWYGRMSFGAVTESRQRVRSAIRMRWAELSLASRRSRQWASALLAVLLGASLAGCASVSGGGKDLAPD